jgi:hypothetical protein
VGELIITRRIISSALLVASVATAQTPYNVELYPYTGASINFGATDHSNIYIGSRFSPYFGFEAGYMSFRTKESASFTPGRITQRVIRMQDHGVQHNGIPDLEADDGAEPAHQQYTDDGEDGEGEIVNQVSGKASEEHKEREHKSKKEDLSSSTDSFSFVDKTTSGSPSVSSPGKPRQGEKRRNSSVTHSENPSPLSLASGFGTENAEVVDEGVDWNAGHNAPVEHPADGEEDGGDGYQEVVIRERTEGVAHVNTTKVYGPYLNATFFLPVYQWECGSFEVFSSVGVSFLTLKSTQEPFYRHHRSEVKTLMARKIIPKLEVGGIYMLGGPIGFKGSVGWINTKKLGKLQGLEKAKPIKNTTYFGAGILYKF